MNDEQRAMKELIEEYCSKEGVSLVSFLSRFRRVDEPIGELIERVYKVIEKSQK